MHNLQNYQYSSEKIINCLVLHTEQSNKQFSITYRTK